MSGKKYLVLASFHIDIPEEGSEKMVRREFHKGETVQEVDIPEGHTGDGLVEAGLAKARHPLDHDGDGRKGGSLPQEPASA